MRKEKRKSVGNSHQDKKRPSVVQGNTYQGEQSACLVHDQHTPRKTNSMCCRNWSMIMIISIITEKVDEPRKWWTTDYTGNNNQPSNNIRLWVSLSSLIYVLLQIYDKKHFSLIASIQNLITEVWFFTAHTHAKVKFLGQPSQAKFREATALKVCTDLYMVEYKITVARNVRVCLYDI